MPRTASIHFRQDINRARAIVAHAEGLPIENPDQHLLRDDLLRSAWMFAVGAMDAYFCDAYVSVVVRTMRARTLQPGVMLPAFLEKVEVPIRSILAQDDYERKNWVWRMAARRKMEADSVLDLEAARRLFNPFFPDKSGKKLFAEVIESWLLHPDATSHLFGITAGAYIALPLDPGAERADARDAAHTRFRKRVVQIIQRRHDCIHNCDRPRTKPQWIRSPGTVRNVIRDIEFTVDRCNEHIDLEFGVFLTRIGCNPVTLNTLRG